MRFAARRDIRKKLSKFTEKKLLKTSKIDVFSYKMRCIKILVLWTLILVSQVMSEDYYSLLGIQKDADNREIRRAYKKLALQYHPDKNKNNEEIQEKFVKISRAYEVLKDSDSRRKYDQFGESGLDDSQQGHYHYQSWNYFENFGIYDDDSNIITLSDSDFSESVRGRSDVWFINFYSPMCSHCHHLAPVWRQLAEELSGVIRIGAVNCGEELGLCRQLSIHSYPSLKLFPQEDVYRGDRTTEKLVDFVLKNIEAKYIKLNKNNIEHHSKEQNLPWLIFLCDDIAECPAQNTKLKLAIMLKNIANVAAVEWRSDFGKSLSPNPGVFYFPAAQITKEAGRRILSNDAQEIFHMALQFLPPVSELSATSLNEILKLTEQKRAHLLWFYSDADEQNILLNQLPYILKHVQVSRVNCGKSVALCREIHVHKYPTFVMLKQPGKYEIYHGRTHLQDIAGFVEDSLASAVESLGPDDFPHRVIQSGEPWFVDFYAPWCPPCLRLLPEWRRASQEIGDIVHFGTVDCTIHQALCSQYKIHSYPTTVFYNQTVPHKYEGQRNFMDIVDFVKETLSPSVVSLTSSTFSSSIEGRSGADVWLVDFFAPWCGPCQQLSGQWKKLAKMLAGNGNIHVAQVDCTANSELCDSQGIRSYPTIRLFPLDRLDYVNYDSYNRDAYSLRAWVYRFLPSRVQELDNNDFYNKVIYSTDKWLVDFYAPWCQHCQHFEPEFERVAQEFGDAVRTAKVNCDILQYICNEAGIRAYPTLRFYPGSSADNWPQNVQGVDVPGQKKEAIVAFVTDYVHSTQKFVSFGDHDEL